MPTVRWRPTFFNPTDAHKAPLSAAHDLIKLRSAAAEHLEHARHARQRGDHIAVAYHESRHAYLTSTKGKLATVLAARTGVQLGHQAGETFGLNIKKGVSPIKHTNTYTLFAGKHEPPAPHRGRGGKKGGGHGGGGGVHHDPSSGRFT